jgi:hypothetical protein
MFEIIRADKLMQSSIQEWHLLKNTTDFNPDYQRVSSIWNLENKQLLIDSIINGLDLPKFYMHYFADKNSPLNEKKLAYAIIDGKQRLESIFQFIEGRISLHNQFVYFANPDLPLAGLSYLQIAEQFPKIKNKFDNFTLDVILVVTDEREKIDELFLRLNEGKQLNSAEKRNAINGYITDEIRRITVEHSFFTEKVAFKNRRYDFYDVLTRLLFLEHNMRELIPFSKKNLDAFVRNNRYSSFEIETTVGNTQSRLDRLSSVFRDKDPLLSTKSIIPVYYVFVSRHFSPDVRTFLENFEDIRKQNRITDDENKNTTLLEFDRLTQQGSSKVVSIINRNDILEKYYILFREHGTLNHLMNIDINDETISDEDE